MQIARLEFQIKRGVVDCYGLDSETLSLVDKCLSLCKQDHYESAVAIIMPLMTFEWLWSNCDGDPSDIFVDVKDINFDLNATNSLVRVGEQSGSCVLTVTAYFDVKVYDGISIEQIEAWLVDYSAYACGYVGGGWSYAESDGDNVWITALK
jgi:hypothetical protein